MCADVAVLQLHQGGNHAYICLTHMHMLHGPPYLLLHSAVCPLPFYTSGRNAHILTNVKRFHGQRMLHGILGDDSHGFVHGFGVAVSV
jgi:hypothetical protein